MGGGYSQEELNAAENKAKAAENKAKATQEEFKKYKEFKEPMKDPWRSCPDGTFTQTKKEQLLQKINDLSPPDPCQAINLMVIGTIGSGKSSFINTIKTVFRNREHLSTIAAPHGINMESTTRRLHEVVLMTFKDGKKLRIYDCRGVEYDDSNTGHYMEDLKKTLDGRIKKDYEFREQFGIQSDSEFNNRNPTISDRMHGLLYVLPAEFSNKEKESVLLEVRRHAIERDIPLRLILTKVDLLELCGYGSMSAVFRSRHVEKQVNKAKEDFEVQDCQILPIANYVYGTEQNLEHDILALLTMDNILEEALTYIKNEIK